MSHRTCRTCDHGLQEYEIGASRRECYRCINSRRPRIPCCECGGPTGWFDAPSARRRARNPVCNPCRRSKPGYRVSNKAAKGMTEAYVCERCDKTWERVATKGQRPKFCPDCRGDYRRWIPVAVRRGVYERDRWVCQICLESVDEG